MNKYYDRKIVLDTETTGMNKEKNFYINHRIIEIGAVEIINRELTGNNFHTYIQPNRKIDPEAFKIHGISNDFLMGKPIFSEIFLNFIKYLNNSEIIMHNASFDTAFLNYEIQKINKKNRTISDISEISNITDTLIIARSLFPGKKNDLNSLSKRYNVNINRKLHSAIIDAEILAKIYLRMTSIQKSFVFESVLDLKNHKKKKNNLEKNSFFKKSLPILYATKSEELEHKKYLKSIKR